MAAGDIAKQDTLGDISSLVGLFTGKSSKTDQSQSTKQNITAAGMQEMLDQILQGNGGIASIMNAEKSAGLYGGSTATLLTNNLATQAAAKLAAAKAGTTTVGSTNTKADPALNPLKTAGAAAAISLLGKSGITAGSVLDLIKSGGSAVSGLLGQGATSSPDPNSLASGDLASLESSMAGQQDFSDLSGTDFLDVSTLFPSGSSSSYDFGMDGLGEDSYDYSSEEEEGELSGD